MKDRIYVRTGLFEGWATIDEYFPNEKYNPIQITLDEPDADGHRVKRVDKKDIVKKELNK